MRVRLLSAVLAVGWTLLLVAAPSGASTFGASTVAVSPDGNAVATGGSGDRYSVFARSPSTGMLTPLGPLQNPIVSGASGCFCRALAFGPESSTIYSVANGRNALLRATVGASGATIADTYANNAAGITGLTGPQALALSPDATNLYASVGYPGQAGIVALARNPATGALTFVEKESTSSFLAWELAISPDGGHLYPVTTSNAIHPVFSRDAATGALSPGEGVLTPHSDAHITALALSPVGDLLFAADRTGRIYTFARDSATGELTHGGHTVVNGQGGVSGLEGVRSLAVSPDGLHLYAAAKTDSALTAFGIGSDGALSFEAALFDGVGGVDGLGEANEVSLSPDGRSIYVAAGLDNGVGVFGRDSGTGLPTFLQLAQDQTGPGGTSPGLVFSGSEGVSIDGGAKYTNDSKVRLTIREPANTTEVRISNDGGFARAQSRSIANGSYVWALRSTGPERLPKTVYVRFGGYSGVSATTFTDDIILDETKPRIQAAALTPALSKRGSARTPPILGGRMLRVKALDRTSGVRRMQVQTKKPVKRPRGRRHLVRRYEWTRYRRSLRIRRGQLRGKLFVRVRDGAGNVSAWRPIRR